MRTQLVLDGLRMAIPSRGPGADVELDRLTPTGAAGIHQPRPTPTRSQEHGILASVGSVGDAYDNAMAESFVDSFKTELIADRVWRTRSQLELAIVDYVAWFNTSACTNRSATSRPRSSSTGHADEVAISGNGSVATLTPRAADRLYAPRFERDRAQPPANSTLSGHRRTGGRLRRHHSLDRRKPTNPVSAEPSPAQGR